MIHKKTWNLIKESKRKKEKSILCQNYILAERTTWGNQTKLDKISFICGNQEIHYRARE